MTSVASRMLTDFPLLLPAPYFFSPVLPAPPPPSSFSSSSPSSSSSSSPFLSLLSHYRGFLAVGARQERLELFCCLSLARARAAAIWPGLRPIILSPSAAAAAALRTAVSSASSSSFSSSSSLSTSRMSVANGAVLVIAVETSLFSSLSARISSLESRWQQSADIHAFLKDLVALIQQSSRLSSSSSLLSSSFSLSSSSSSLSLYSSSLFDSSSSSSSSSSGFYREMIKELNALGWERVTSLSQSQEESNRSFSLSLSLIDSDRRVHSMRVELEPSFYPRSAPLCQVALPIPFDFTWISPASSSSSSSSFSSSSSLSSSSESSSCSSIVDLYRRWTVLIDLLQSFYRVLSDIDAHCDVLHPDPPVMHVSHRRIVIWAGVTASIELEPREPMKKPTIRWLGQRAAPFQLKFEHFLYDSSRTVRQNIEQALNLTLPSPRAENNREREMENPHECVICYLYMLNGVAPDIECANEKCSRFYHSSCLYQWLMKDATSTTIFDACVGKCINCSASITVKQQRW